MAINLEKHVKDMIKNMRMLNVWTVAGCNIEKFKEIYPPNTPAKGGDVVIIYRQGA